MPANGRYPKNYTVSELRKFCDDNKLAFIEDSAQCLGSWYPPAQCGGSEKRHMGSIGDIGSFSFSAPKVISTGQGGESLHSLWFGSFSFSAPLCCLITDLNLR